MKNHELKKHLIGRSYMQSFDKASNKHDKQTKLLSDTEDSLILSEKKKYSSI